MTVESLLHDPRSNRAQNLSKNYRYGWSRGTLSCHITCHTFTIYTRQYPQSKRQKIYKLTGVVTQLWQKSQTIPLWISDPLFGPKIHAKTVFDKGYHPKLHESYLTEKTWEIWENFAEIASVQFIGRRDVS